MQPGMLPRVVLGVTGLTLYYLHIWHPGPCKVMYDARMFLSPGLAMACTYIEQDRAPGTESCVPVPAKMSKVSHAPPQRSNSVIFD